jgi:hypothetical protein
MSGGRFSVCEAKKSVAVWRGMTNVAMPALALCAGLGQFQGGGMNAALQIVLQASLVIGWTTYVVALFLRYHRSEV